MKEYKDWGDQFQTPEDVCEYMASYIVPERYYDETGEEMTRCNILEPTPGRGNLVKYLVNYGGVFSPAQGSSFFDMEKRRYDWVVMNPPFTPMQLGYDILYEVMNLSDNIVALMPWLTLINSEKRTKLLMEFGMKSVTHLPRSIFKGARVQTCIINLKKGFRGDTVFRNYTR